MKDANYILLAPFQLREEIDEASSSRPPRRSRSAS
jgi:hypothetical protein